MTPIWKKRADEKIRLSTLAPPEEDERKDLHGVLLVGEIERLCHTKKLIWPFDLAHLRPASYRLTVGKDYFLGGEYFTIKDDENSVVIRPFEVVVLQTAETIRMPLYLIGRWNIKVTHAYKGLLWVGGPQVDPGWVGHLFCPIYNLSDKEVTLRCGEEIAVIDFVKTTPFSRTEVHDEKHEVYPFPPDNVILEDYGILISP